MKKLMMMAALAAMLAVTMTGSALAGNGNAPGHANADGTVRGTAPDASAPILGDVEYLFNPAGYHFWFTATATNDTYVAGHSYHNIYKYDVEDATDWCGPVNIPHRAPYNAGGTDGGTAYYKIWNVTTASWVCGSE